MLLTNRDVADANTLEAAMAQCPAVDLLLLICLLPVQFVACSND